MSVASVVLFASVYALACAMPGPTLVALIARVVGRGTAGILPFCLGLVIGDLTWLCCAAFGLAALAALFQPLFLVVRYLGAAYLLFLAWKMWTRPEPAPGEVAPAGMADAGALRMLGGGLALALGNPKTMLFYLAVLPSVLAVTRLHVAGFMEIALVLVVVYSLVLTGYVLLAARLRRLVRDQRAVRVMNRTSGAVIAGAAVAVVVRA